jgi:hypothetical protein
MGMRKRTIGPALATLLALLAIGIPAAANTPESFTTCIAPDKSSTYCESGDTYLVGSTLWFRGKVKPAHAGKSANVLIKEPGNDEWTKVDTDTVSDTGKLSWTWKTEASDANTDAYRLRFKIPDHGKSEVATVWLIPGSSRP